MYITVPRGDMHRTNDWALFISRNRILDAKALYVFPIIVGRKVEHLYQNIEALELSLSPGQIKALDDIVPFDKGFPFNAFVRISTEISSSPPCSPG